jgi:predicted ATPase
MINRFAVQNYKALQDIGLELTRIHALIGPNDSGKTSILNAVAALSRTADYPLQEAFLGSWDGRELVWHGDPDGVVRLSFESAENGDDFKYTLASRFPNSGRRVVVEAERFSSQREIDLSQQGHRNSRVREVCIDNQKAPEEVNDACSRVHAAIAGTQYCRWNPRALAVPTAPDSKRRFRLNHDGFGLALFLDDILGHDRELFGQLEKRFRSVFPEISSIKLKRQMGFRSPPDDFDQVSRLEQAEGKGVFFELAASKQQVPAAQASDGVLLILAYLALLFSPEPPRLILIEEPENGIHPRRLQEVLGLLRELVSEQARTQVLLTTHSPYAVDLFSPEEVTLCTKDGSGAVVTKRLADSETVREQLSVFTLGEIWTAEGDEDLAKDGATSPSR